MVVVKLEDAGAGCDKDMLIVANDCADLVLEIRAEELDFHFREFVNFEGMGSGAGQVLVFSYEIVVWLVCIDELSN